jgi:PAS domain S-box-containing protein
MLFGKKNKLNFSIRRRICLSFLLFVLLFFINGSVVMLIVLATRNKALHIATVIDPSLRKLDDFHDMVVSSKMYTTNWVYFSSRQSDKDSLAQIHNVQYPQLKTNLIKLSGKWLNQHNVVSLKLLISDFEAILHEQKRVIALLQEPDDYNELSKKVEADKILQQNIIPASDYVASSVFALMAKERTIKTSHEKVLEKAFQKLWIFILLLIIITLIIAFFLSRYFTTIIVKPISQIRTIVEGLAKGETEKITCKNDQNEMTEMITAVNNLSARLKYTALFAKNIGERNYDLPFEPLSPKDLLGHSLVAMRNNLKFLDESLSRAQHIARIGNWDWDFKTNEISWSDELYNLFGKERSVFKPSFDAVIKQIHPEDIDGVLAEFNDCIQNHRSISLECRIIRDTGEIKHILAQVNVSVDENHELCKLFGVIQDITERIHKDTELKQTTERFNNLLKATNDSIWDWNLFTDEVWWNNNFYEVFGFDPSKPTPTVGEWIMNIHVEDRAKVVNKLKAIGASNENSWHGEFRYWKKDGTMGFAFNRAYVVRDEKGKPIRVIGAIYEITERKNAIRQIAQSEKRYRQIVETAQEGIWLIDENNYTVFVNRKMCEMLEYSAEEIIGKKDYDFKDRKETKKAEEQIEKRKEGVSEQYESSYITKSGKRLCVFVSANPVFDDEGNYKGALGMVTDITQRKMQEELLKKSEADLELQNEKLAQKNTELEQFAYIASHDLQEPLRTVTSFAELLQNQYRNKLDSVGQKYLYFIQQGTERMKTLITDLLEYSRIGRGKALMPVDCNEIVKTVIADLDAAIHESNVEIKTERLPVVNGYNTEMKQLFQNLVVNAIKFRKKEVAPQIHITSRPITGGWEFKIQDNGIGIDEQHNERIFAIFQRLHTRSEYEGAGIGLSHCKKIVELHGGKIWVRSKPGEGSTFHFTILENYN